MAVQGCRFVDAVHYLKPLIDRGSDPVAMR